MTPVEFTEPMVWVIYETTEDNEMRLLEAHVSSESAEAAAKSLHLPSSSTVDIEPLPLKSEIDIDSLKETQAKYDALETSFRFRFNLTQLAGVRRRRVRKRNLMQTRTEETSKRQKSKTHARHSPTSQVQSQMH